MPFPLLIKTDYCFSARKRSQFSPTWPEDGVTTGDMKPFLAMIIAMGLVNQENIQDYWSTDEVLLTPFFLQLMTRNKFWNVFSLV